MWHVGVDVHLKSCSVCVLDENGRQVLEKTVRGPWTKLVEYLARFEAPPFASALRRPAATGRSTIDCP